MTFGKMPIANGFLTEAEFKGEYFYELAPAFCSKCGGFQIVDQPDPEQMFHENYAYFTSTSQFMVRHFRDLAEKITRDYLKTTDPFVVEIGCNDGGVVQAFSDMGVRHLGVEPSQNVADAARAKGVNIACRFFDEALTAEIVNEHGQADAFVGANVLAHIGDIHPVFAGVKKLLKPNGVMITENPYLGDMIENVAYDQIYDEHVFVHSLASIESLARRHGLQVTDVEALNTHGGSIRYVLAHEGVCESTDAVTELRAHEKWLGLGEPETYEKFRIACEKSRDSLMALLNDLRDQKKRVAGYGATAKSTTVAVYCGITPEHVEFISDTTPTKQNKCTPGAHIPVKGYDHFKKNYPGYAVLFAWNHKKEIMAKEDEFIKSGGKWVSYIPGPEVEIF